MLRHRLAALIGAMAVVSTVFLFAGAAQAQTYPPGTSVPSCTPGDANAGTVAVSQSIKFILCGNFAAGATITITVNGTPISVSKTPFDGAVTVEIKVLSTTAIEVDDPIQVAIACGTTNTVTASGPMASGGTGVSHGTFVVACASTSTASTTPSSGLAFTGGNVLMALIVAALLILLGAVLVIVQRRRRQSL